MTHLRLPDVRTPRSLGPPHLLNRLLGRASRRSALAAWPSAHGTTAAAGRHGTDFTPAATPFCANLRLLLPVL
jgi:hypothetical protein